MKLIGYAFFISYRQPTLALFLRVDNFYSLNERLSLGQTKSMVSTSGVFPSDAEVYLNVSPEGETAAAPPCTRKRSCARSHRSTNRTCGHDVCHLQRSLSQHSWAKLRLLRMQACHDSIFVILTLKKTKNNVASSTWAASVYITGNVMLQLREQSEAETKVWAAEWKEF